MSGHVAGDGRDWPAEVWSWSPKLGRWSPKYGNPKQPVIFELSTASVSPEEAYDYWRDMAYYYFEADRIKDDRKRNFRAHTTVLSTPVGNIYAYQSGPVSGRRTNRDIRIDGGDFIDVGIVLRGRRYHRDETDRVYVATSGQFFCYDAAKASQVAWSDHQGVHLTIPRKMIEAAIGDIPPATEISKALAGSYLSPFLTAHFGVLSRTLKGLPLVERAIIFDYTVDFILSVLRQALRPSVPPTPADRISYFLAAKQFIYEQLSNPNLDAAMVARALNCSRSTLYRAFAEQGWTVAGYIRETRMRKAAEQLSQSDAKSSIKSIALSCGFVSPSHFSRLFRARFGVTPSDARLVPWPQDTENPESPPTSPTSSLRPPSWTAESSPAPRLEIDRLPM